ncbi:MAG: 2-oxoglutarate dehydrogenase complex dihydrolipoyllysine-residue succinyltransferase [SAR324 cluster bacterium]|nr:2-oxoglutarate dehydrogenase complex dihydrolipoyllysine-residue succinyltransferase [SAR324 cluster bacterium]
MAVDIKIPSPGESITEVEIGNWMKADGDFVQMDEPLCEIETDKATLPLPAETSGILKIVLQTGETAQVGDVLCSIEPSDAPAVASKPAAAEPAPTPAPEPATAPAPQPESYAAGHPSPAANKLMAEQGVAAAAVSGTGPGGRITKQDVLEESASSTPAPEVPSAPPASAPETPDPQAPPAPPVVAAVSGARQARWERMSRLRRKLSERLVAVKNETAMLTTFNEVDMQAIFDLRSAYKDHFEKKHGVRLGFMSFFAKACCEALLEFPAVNAQIDGEEMVSHDYVDMGIAVSAPKGLMVPVVRNAETLSLAQLESEIRRLAKRARDNAITPDEMNGGTFSITNGGVFGSMLSTPILNPPQSAILGMHNIVERPIAVNGTVVVRPIMYLALSYDHRIIDGQQSVRFLVRVKEYLETPARLLLGV